MSCNPFLLCVSFPKQTRWFVRMSENWSPIHLSNDWQGVPPIFGAFMRAAFCMSSFWSHPRSSCCVPWGRKLPGQDLFTRQSVSLKHPGTLSLHICKFVWNRLKCWQVWVRAGGAEITLETYINILPFIHAKKGLHKAMLQCIQAQCTVINQILLDLVQNKQFHCWSVVYTWAFRVWWQLFYTNWPTAQFTFFCLFILSWNWGPIPSSKQSDSF